MLDIPSGGLATGRLRGVGLGVVKLLDRALQVHGGLGMTDDTPIAYWYRHERAARIYDGPDEVHKWSVARRILGGYR